MNEGKWSLFLSVTAMEKEHKMAVNTNNNRQTLHNERGQENRSVLLAAEGASLQVTLHLKCKQIPATKIQTKTSW